MEPITNRYARSQYHFLDTWDAGIILTGAETKSVKKGMLNLKGAYVSFENGELWLKNAHISPYQMNNQKGYSPTRDRKLLLKKHELTVMDSKSHEKGLTLIPEKVYSKHGLIKVSVALAQGLKQHDKRAKIKKRDNDRDIARALKQY
jgi:SsrA-binding protein